MKKVLIITYYWPPAGGPGVQRWLKFVKYLPDFAITPVVYIPENPTYPILDENLHLQVSKNVEIISHKIFEPYTIASLLSKKEVQKISAGIIPDEPKQSWTEKISLWMRGNLFIPDARVLWVQPSVNYLQKYILENDISTIITTGPPHSVHLIGNKLKTKLNVRWIADFRDPWTTIGYHKSLKLSAFAAKKHKSLEREVLSSADEILVTSKSTKVEFSKITSKPIHVITNGYDIENVQSQKLDSKFSIAHIGSLLSERNPLILWEILAELIDQNPVFKTDFELKLIGTVSEKVLKSISDYKLNGYVNNLGYVQHSEAIAEQRKSQILLLIEIDSDATKAIIPGKLFEYMVSGRPILAIGPESADFAEIIAETNTGEFVTYGEREKLKSVILEYYQTFQTGNLHTNPISLQQFSRKNLTGKLADILLKPSHSKSV